MCWLFPGMHAGAMVKALTRGKTDCKVSHVLDLFACSGHSPQREERVAKAPRRRGPCRPLERRGNMVEENFDVLDESGNPTGVVKGRKAVHRDGALHLATRTRVDSGLASSLLVGTQEVLTSGLPR